MTRAIVILVLLVVALVATVWLAPEAVVRAALGGARLAAGLESRQAQVDGLPLHYLAAGKGPVVILVHGFGGDADNWLRLAPHLSKRYRVLLPDLPGFGRSPAPPAGGFDVTSQARRLAAFIRTQTDEPVHLAGNSMGGQIVAVLAAQNPGLVASVALLNPLGAEGEQGAGTSPTMQRLSQGRNLLLPRDRGEFREMLDVMFHERPPLPGFFSNYYADRWIAGRPRLATVFADITAGYVPLVPLLSQIQAPVLILWGEQDQVLPAGGAQVLARASSHSEVALIPNCGHLPMIEKPAATAAIYLPFLDGSDSR